jgi:putative nucleotidyltransferase with HDIG domain
MGLAVAVHIASEFTGRLQLSVFPYLLEKLIHSLYEPSAELAALSRLIRMDPALCFLAMRLDRSLGSDSQAADTTGIDDVVRRIGMAGIDAITTQALADQGLNGVHHHQALALGWLWRHCLTTALLAQRLALELHYHPAEEAYTAGLLHDIGKLALFARTPAECAPMLIDADQASPLLKAEENIAGADHGRIGAQLIRQYTGAWFAADTAKYHTASAAEVVNALPLVQLVWAANRLSAAPQPSSEACQTVARLLHLDTQQLLHFSRTALEQALTAANELGVVSDVPEKTWTSDTPTIPMSQEIKTSTVLSNVYKEMLTAVDPIAIIRALRQSLSAFLGIDALIIFDHEPKSDLLIGRFAAGAVFPLHINRLRIPLTASDCLPVLCHRSGETVNSFSGAHREKPTIIDQQLMAYMHKDGIVCMPFRSRGGEGASLLVLGLDAGDWPWVEQQTTLLKAIAAAVAGVLESAQQHAKQEKRQAAERAASAVLKTRKIVHEINNPLSVIKNYLNVLTLKTDENRSANNELRIIEEEINRVATLIKSLTSPSETIPINHETVDVNATVIDTLGLFRESLPANTAIRLHQDLDRHLPLIPSDRNRLKQALINLLKNAMEAILDEGTIRVSTRMFKGSPGYVGDKGEAGQIRISVCDDGPGIDEGIKNELFKPNVTSKKGHEGLGLSIVHEAVAHLKGTLLCESTPGRGTCFHIELPAGDNGPENGTALDSAI